MTEDIANKVEAFMWFAGVIFLAIGSGFQWGWPASLIALGAAIFFWMLCKQIVEAR